MCCAVVEFTLKCPSFISVTVSVLSIEGTDCRLDELGRLADRTGGKVRYDYKLCCDAFCRPSAPCFLSLSLIRSADLCLCCSLGGDSESKNVAPGV